jgi:hypothetical protein
MTTEARLELQPLMSMSSKPPEMFVVDDALPLNTAWNRTDFGEFADAKQSDWMIDGAEMLSHVGDGIETSDHTGTLDPFMVTVTAEVE